MGAGEIVTLQLGGYANFVGAHFWNFQDEVLGLSLGDDMDAAVASEIDANVLFRQGETVHGAPSFNPRAVMVDLKGSLGALATQEGAEESNSLVQSLQAVPAVQTWGGGVTPFVSEPAPQTAFVQALWSEAPAADAVMGEYSAAAGGGGAKDMEEEEEEEDPDADDPVALASRSLPQEVAFWPDYLKAVLHARTVVELPGLWRGVATFDGFGDGAQVEGATTEELLDRVRFFAEECDGLQGFHVLAEGRSGFGALTAGVMEELRDTYGSRPLLLYDVNPPEATPGEGEEPENSDPEAQAQAAARRRQRKQVSTSLATATLTEHADFYVPLNRHRLSPALGPHVSFREASAYESSAVYAAAIDGTSTGYRLRSRGVVQGPQGERIQAPQPLGAIDLHTLTRVLSSQGGPPLVALGLALPCPALEGGGPSQGEDTRVQQQHTLEAESAFSLAPLAEGIEAGAGGTRARVWTCRGGRGAQGRLEVPTVSTWMQKEMAKGMPCMRHWVTASQPLAVPLSYPPLFAPSVLRHGDLCRAGDAPRRAGGVLAAPLLVELAATAAFAPVLDRHTAALKSATAAALLRGWGYDTTEAEEVRERMRSMSQGYSEGDQDSDFSD